MPSLVTNSRYALDLGVPPLRRAQPKRAGDSASISVWEPQAGPQRTAYESAADVIGYGGAAGGGKSDMLLGFAGTQHQRAVIFRRVFPSLRGLIERSREIFARGSSRHAQDSYNEQLHVWRLADGKTIEFGAVQYEQDRKKYQGQPHDFIGVDEATEFPEATVRFLMGWNRTTAPGQRCRVVLTFNPPMDDAGAWVVRFFAPWLDEEYPIRADDGDLLYVTMVDGAEQFYRAREDAPESLRALLKTRTFFHASLKDNPILAATGYGATIEALPEPLRSLLKGNFHAARQDDPWQVIPPAWVRAAQQRWKERATADYGAPTAIGVDVARGGQDKTVIARLHGTRFAPLEKHPGVATPDGQSVAGLVIRNGIPDCPIGVDVIGVGASAFDMLRTSGARALAVNFAEGAQQDRDKSGKLRFRNVRAAAYWKMRESLDPISGDDLALPDDPELLADLCAPRWEITPGGILIEDKDAIRERLNRSPDCGDTVVIAHWTVRRGFSNSAIGAFS